MRFSDIQLLNEKHWNKRSSSSSSSNFKDKKHNHARYNRHEHEHEHDNSVPHRDSHERHKRRIKQRKQHNQHSNHEHNKSRHFDKKRRNHISINLNTPRVQHSRPLPRTSSTTTRVPQEWDGNQWVDANSTEFVTTTNRSRPDNTMPSEKLEWDGSEWSADAGVTMADLNAASDTQRMMHQDYEVDQFNKRQKK